jgi:hypothetical protein
VTFRVLDIAFIAEQVMPVFFLEQNLKPVDLILVPAWLLNQNSLEQLSHDARHIVDLDHKFIIRYFIDHH